MRCIFVFLGLLMCKSFPAKAQANAGMGAAYMGSSNTLLLNTPELYLNVEGSPYLPSATFMPGWVMQGNAKLAQNLRYNALTGQVEFRQNGKLNGVTLPAQEVCILASPTDTLRLERGYAPVATHTPLDFYQVLYRGTRFRLLKRTQATIKANTEPMSTDFGKKSFALTDEYFVWYVPAPLGNPAPGSTPLLPVMNTRRSLTTALPQEAIRIEQFATDQKTKLRTWPEVVALLRHLDR